jgi:site-specific DNA-methyltransferase (adenine-specific)
MDNLGYIQPDTLVHGDCLEEMKRIESGSVDLILTDLPYAVTNCKWDTLIPFEPLWEAYKRIIKPSGAIVLTADEPFTSALILSNVDWFKYRWTWDKANPTGFLNAKIQPLRVTEDVCIFYKSQCTYNPEKEVRGKPRNKGNYNKIGGSDNYGTFHNVTSFNNEYYPVNLIRISNAHKHGKTHPTQKPVPLFEYLIRTYTNEGETVLDSCMGSGTTPVACIQSGRRYIGIEQDETYFNASVTRIRAKELEIASVLPL